MGDMVNVDNSDVKRGPHSTVDIRDGVDDLGDIVVKVKDDFQTDQTEQLHNDANSG